MDKSRLFFGSLLIVLGFVFVVDSRLDFDAWSLVWKSTPLLLVGLGVWLIAIHRHKLFVGFFIALFGLILFIGNLGIINVSFGSIWPLLLIGLGLSFIFREQDASYEKDGVEQLNDLTILGENKHAVSSDNFKSGNITVILGSSEIDLSNVKAKGDIILQTLSVLAELKIKLPSNATVVSEVVNILGESKGLQPSNSMPDSKGIKVIIRGAVILGSVSLA